MPAADHPAQLHLTGVGDHERDQDDEKCHEAERQEVQPGAPTVPTKPIRARLHGLGLRRCFPVYHARWGIIRTRQGSSAPAPVPSSRPARRRRAPATRTHADSSSRTASRRSVAPLHCLLASILHSSIASSVADGRVVGLPAPAVCSSADAMGPGGFLALRGRGYPIDRGNRTPSVDPGQPTWLRRPHGARIPPRSRRQRPPAPRRPSLSSAGWNASGPTRNGSRRALPTSGWRLMAGPGFFRR